MVEGVAQEHGETLQLVLDSALDGVIVLRLDGSIGDWNKQAEIIFGFTRAEVVGQLLDQLIIPIRYREAHRQGLKTYLTTGDGPLLRKRVEIFGLRKSGDEFPLELSISPIRHNGETLFLGFVRDITERREAARRLEAQTREAVLLHRVTSLAAETSSLEDVLRLCLDSVCELTGWSIGHAILPGPLGSAELISTAIWSGAVEAFPELRRITDEIEFSKGKGLPGHIWQTGAPLWISDITKSHMFPRAAAAENLEVASAFGFPIHVDNEVVAVLEFFALTPIEPDPNLVLTVKTMGNQVGRVLERRRVHEHQTLLLAELDHRAKNMLAVVMGISTQTARGASSIASFQETFYARLNSLARAYGLLTAKHWKPMGLDALIAEVVKPQVGEDDWQFEFSGAPVMLTPKAALGVSMILHELTTNATKYGALSQVGGKIVVNSTVDMVDGGRLVRLDWCEQGLADIRPPTRSGFGTRLIEASVRLELGGRAEVRYEPSGVRYHFEFPEPA